MLIERLLIETVEDRYKYDVEFFSNESFKMYPATWSRFRNGKVSLMDMKYGKVSDMLDLLFSPLEIQLILEIEAGAAKRNLLKSNTSYDEYMEDSKVRYYFKKKELLKKWIKSGQVKEVIKKRYSLPDGRKSSKFLMVMKDNYNYLYFTIKDVSLFDEDITNNYLLGNIGSLK